MLVKSITNEEKMTDSIIKNREIDSLCKTLSIENKRRVLEVARALLYAQRQQERERGAKDGAGEPMG